MKIAELAASNENAPQTPMPGYISHKRVWALKIAKVHQDEDGQGVALQFERPGFALRAFTSSQLEGKPMPQAGMYFVQYGDGYFFADGKDSDEMDLTELHAIIANHAGEIADLFKRSHGIKVTILARNPTLEDGDVVVSNDSIEAAISALRKLESRR